MSAWIPPQGFETGPRLDCPPQPEAMAALPTSFGCRFLIFVDTEEEFDWAAPRRRDAAATTAVAALPEAHHRLRERGVTPTYLVDYPVADSHQAAAILRPLVESGQCAIGAQLHPWVNPPFEEELSRFNSFPGNLLMELEREKLARLTVRIEQNFGVRPVAYRAGRYGIGPNTAALLQEAGYRLDVSVRALFDYSAENGPDFSGFPVAPWWVGGLLELPLTSVFTGRLRHAPERPYRVAGRIPHGRGVLARSGLLNRVALTPEGTPAAEAIDAIRALLDDGVRLFSLSFHSPSIEPGHTPYVRDAADLIGFWRWWDAVFDLFAREGVEPAGVDALIAAAWGAEA